VAEVGTGTAWTAIALALAEANRRVHTYDVELRPERARYLALVPSEVRERIELLPRPSGVGPERPPPVDLLFIDSSHLEAETVETFEAWLPVLPSGARVLFHDFGDPAWPGVEAAVRRLGLRGTRAGSLFVWNRP